MCLPVHSPLIPNLSYSVGRGPVPQGTSVLPALGLKDSYLIPLSINKIRHSDKAPSPELFLQHYVIGLPGQETFLNKAFRSPSVWVWPVLPSYTHSLQPQLNNEETFTRVTGLTTTPPRGSALSLRRSASGPGGGPCGGQRRWKACPQSNLRIHRAGIFLRRGCSCCHTHPSCPRGQETLHTFGCGCPLPNFLGFLIFIHE